MNYKHHYQRLIDTRKNINRSKKTGTYEKHHIIPKCLGGSNKKDNIILLTPREHYIAHLLLTQMYTGKIKSKLCCAFMRMCTTSKNHKRNISSKQYELAKKLLSDNYRGVNNPFYGKPSSNRGRKLSEETKEKIRQANLGRKSKMKGKKLSVPSWNLGGTIPKEQKEKIREKLSRIIIEYDLEGNKLNEYIGVPEAARITGLNKTTIYMCCNKKKHYQTNGRTFRYKGDIFDYVKYIKIGKGVIQKDIKTNLVVKEYDSIKTAAKAIKISIGAITNCCRGRSKTAGGYYWEYG